MGSDKFDLLITQPGFTLKEYSCGYLLAPPTCPGTLVGGWIPRFGRN